MRLVLMARFGMDLPTALIEEQIAMAIDLIVVTRRLASGERLVSSLTEVSRGEGGEAVLTECVAHDPTTSSWSLSREPSFVGVALEAGTLSREEVEAWRSRLS